MTSVKIASTISEDLAQAAELIRKRHNYRNMSELIRVLLWGQILHPVDPVQMSEFAALSPEERDKLDAAMLATAKKSFAPLSKQDLATGNYQIVRAA